MAAGRHSCQRSVRDGGDCDVRGVRDGHHVDADDDVETILVAHSVDWRLSCGPNVRSALSMQSVVVAPYRAHRCPA